MGNLLNTTNHDNNSSTLPGNTDNCSTGPSTLRDTLENTNYIGNVDTMTPPIHPTHCATAGNNDITCNMDTEAICHEITHGLLDNLTDITPSGKNIIKNVHDDQLKTSWYPRPFISHLAPESTVRIYEATVQQKTVNWKGARYPIKSSLNTTAWLHECTGHPDDELVLNGVMYGFPLQYSGGPLYRQAPPVQNHHSARQHSKEIDKYIQTEMLHGTLIGPFRDPPFTPWAHISPLMTRPKSDTKERRIIVDLSYPDGGINAHIGRNQVDGQYVYHNLPTVHQALDVVREVGMQNAFLASIDISRAYRNFTTCPSDWPLLNIHHNGSYFIDTAMPFGSRMSSFFMTSVANFIERALKKRGITAITYLDDMLIIGKDKQNTEDAYEHTLLLLSQLGLPVAARKLIPPTRKLVWLGVTIDLDQNSISIPNKKLEEIRSTILDVADKQTIQYRHLQSVIGAINHIAKATPPARLFMSRMLEALREAAGGPVKIDDNMLADINWFKKYLRVFNGRAIIHDKTPAMIIEADACLSGLGAHDGSRFYTLPVTENMAKRYSISRLECLNCLLAARTFISAEYGGKTVVIKCDNEATVYTYQNGKARDTVMLACARAMWFISATFNVNIIVVHIPGVDMYVADALSRVYAETSAVVNAQRIIADMKLSPAHPKYSDLDYSNFL